MTIKVQQCLDLFFDQENSRNTHDHDIKCPACNKSGEVLQKYSLIRIPAHLVLVLKRYTFTSSTNLANVRVSKNLTNIELVEQLDLREHVFGAGDNKNCGGEGGGTVYELGSVCVHLGSSPRSGHYVALVKHLGKWWRVSDEKFRECSPADWDEAQKNCYILFYDKVRTSHGGARQPLVPGV